MEIESNVKRILVSILFIKNELLCIVDAEGFHKREHQKFRNDIYRLIKNCDSVFSIPKKQKDEIEDTILAYQEFFIGMLEATPEQLEKIKEILNIE